jgi:hypothetical protein
MFISPGSRVDLMKWLDVFTNVAVLLVCALLVVEVSGRYASRSPRPAVPERADVYKAGDTVEAIGLQVSDATRTVVLVVSSHCGFCRNSLPFYQRLSAMAGATKSTATRVVAVCPEPQATCSSFLADGQVQVDEVVGLPDRRIRVRGTPTVIVLDANRTISHIWTGQLDRREEEEAIQTLFGPS